MGEQGEIMCIPHAPNKTFKTDKRERKNKTKKSIPFNKKSLEPDLDFIDERKKNSLCKKKEKGLFYKLFSFLY